MADGAVPPVHLAAGQSPPGQHPSGQAATAQSMQNTQLAEGHAAAPRRPWATRPADHPPQASAQPQTTARPQTTVHPQIAAQSQTAMPGEATMPAVEAVAHVASVAQPVDGQGALQAMIARLRSLGAAYFRLENWGQLSYFRCEMPLKDDPRYHAYFEATNADPIVAVREVLDKIEKWQGQQSPGTMIATPPPQPGGPRTR